MSDAALGAREMVDGSGLPYAQLHYWTVRRYLRADNPSPGKGTHLSWPVGEMLVARVMRILVDRCGMTPGKASELARSGGLHLIDGSVRVVIAWEVVGDRPVRGGDPGRPDPDRVGAPAGVLGGWAG